MERISQVLDEYGKPFVHLNGKPRPELAQAMNLANPIRRQIATYDAARDTDEFKNYWANSDNYDADSANSPEVRRKLTSRSRYETGNNGFADGIAQTYATDLVGIGPKLRMQTGNTAFNQLIEREWELWCKAVKLRRKLWCMAHAKGQDGEGFGVLRSNPKVNHAVKLDLVLYETEQFQTPYLGLVEEGKIDGMEFDKFSNVETWNLLRRHPGSSNAWDLDMEPERIPARFVLQWFKLRRPGQHRAVPESASTLNTGAAARRWREATIATAETQADYSLVMKTQMTPDEADAVAPFSTMDIAKRQMAFLPAGWDPFQLEGKLPAASHEAFHKSLVNEQGRPKSMPLNKSMCNSADYNYASGRLDHQTYYSSLDVDRADGDDLVLDPIFAIWFDEAIRVFRWFGGDPSIVGPGARAHGWDWPKHRVADVESEANANNTNLRNGSLSLSKRYNEAGDDFEDEVAKMATDFGVTVAEMRTILLRELYPTGSGAVSGGTPPGAQPAEPVVAAMFAEMKAMRADLDRFIRSNR